MSKTTVIHHSADWDGIFCREIARKFLGNEDVEYIGWDFKDEPIDIHTVGERAYILDLPIDRVFGWDFKKKWPESKAGLPTEQICWDGSSNEVIWIDHHKSAIESHPANIPGYRIDGVAACRLAWQWFIAQQVMGDGNCAKNFDKTAYFNRTVSEPLAVRLAGEYDIWDKRDPNAELFQHGLRSQELSPGTWEGLLSIGAPADHLITRLLHNGLTIQFVRDNEYADVITQQGFDVQFEGLTFLACNSHELDIRSQLFAAGIKPHHDALLGFTYNGAKKDWRVSMYHAPGKEHHDLSLIAVKHGGGGHRGACGFRVPKLPFLS